MKSADKKGGKKKSGNGNRGITQLGVLIEDVRDDVKLIAEQYGDIKNALDTHTAMFEQHRVILDRHTAKLDAHTEMIGTMARDVEVIKMDIAFIKSGLKKKVDEEEFRALEKRVAILERRK